MKKRLLILLFVLAVSVAIVVPAFAGTILWTHSYNGSGSPQKVIRVDQPDNRNVFDVYGYNTITSWGGNLVWAKDCKLTDPIASREHWTQRLAVAEMSGVDYPKVYCAEIPPPELQ